MKIAMIGSGAAGSVFAAYLRRGGGELWLVDKYKAHMDKIASDGLVFRVNTKADYNYQANDDVPADYGMTLQALQNVKKGYDEQSKLHTRLIKVRKELILTAHPRMQPIPGTVKHSVSFQGTETEVLRRNANIDFQDE